MREIKFRVWGIHQKSMKQDITLEALKCFGTTINNSINSEVCKSGVVVMQFTGLKDKNGKEIYEGDIVVDTNYQVKIPMGIIEWFDKPIPGFCFQIKKNMDIYGDEYEDWNDLEVIGNIHKNPELLK